MKFNFDNLYLFGRTRKGKEVIFVEEQPNAVDAFYNRMASLTSKGYSGELVLEPKDKGAIGQEAFQDRTKEMEKFCQELFAEKTPFEVLIDPISGRKTVYVKRA